MSRFATDAVVLVLLAAGAAALSWQASGRVSAALRRQPPVSADCDDIWFDADACSFTLKLLQPNHEQTMTLRHPLVSLIARLPLRLHLRLVPSADPAIVVRTALLVMAAVWTALMFAALRLLRVPLPDATLFTSIGATSASAVFANAAPETFGLGSITIVVAIMLVGLAGRGIVSEWLTTLVCAATLSVTLSPSLRPSRLRNSAGITTRPPLLMCVCTLSVINLS